MNGPASDARLDALLRDLPPPPPVPADLAARVLAAAAMAPQEPRPARARRAAAPRDRRGRWFRRPLLAGTAALGLLVTSAVAATLAGVPIPQKIAAVFFPGAKAPAPKQAAAPRPASRPAPVAAVPVQTAEAKPAADGPAWAQRPGPWRRLLMAQRIIEARRAMGLPTPGADRIERQLRRRAEMWRNATPEQRAQWLERQRERREARQAVLATPEGQAALAARQEQMQRWRAQRQAGIPLTPEQRAERQQMMREWRAQRQAGRPPLTEEQRTARQERFRQWRQARRARWQGEGGRVGANMQAGPEGPDVPDR
jgi:hypothetical protein